MPDDRTRDEKIADYRTKFPGRVARLRAVLLPLLGMHAYTKLSPETLAEMVDPHVDKVIAAAWGLDA